MKKTMINTSIILALGASIGSWSAIGQENEVSNEVSNEAEAIEAITIVGSRVPGRSLQDSVVPVDVLTAEDLAQSGAIGGEIGSLLQANIPSFNMPRQSNSDHGDIIRTAQLRGLNPDQVLVLVNGKRRHISAVVGVESKLGRGSAAVDFNNIPTSAIERIEVLRDGAAAQYGSDAIAGVINIVLKKGDTGGDVSVSYGAHITSLDVIDDGDITDGQTSILTFNKGINLGNGYLNISGDYRQRSATNRAGYDQQIPLGWYDEFETGEPALENLPFSGKRNFRMGDGDSEDLNLSFNAGYSLTSDTEIYGFGTFADRNAEGTDFFRYPVESFAQENILSVHPNGYIPGLYAEVVDMSLAGGIKTVLNSGWYLDSSLVYGRNEFEDNFNNSINVSLGENSPTDFHRSDSEYSQIVLNVEGTNDYDLGDISVYITAGTEYRIEYYKTKAGDPTSYIDGGFGGTVGVVGGAGLTPEETVDVDRNALSLFLDAEFLLTEDLTVSTAARYEDYSDFGSTVTGKLAGRYEIIEGLAIRAGISTGFRAPALAQSFISGTTTSFGDGGQIVASKTYPVSHPNAIAYGAEELQAEESLNKSFGLVWSYENFNLTFDYYQIDIDDRIALSETITVSDITGVEGIRFFTNVVDTETEGFDIFASYDWDNFSFSAAYNNTNTDVVNSPDRAIFGIEETNTYETAAPESKVILSTTWKHDEWLSLLLRATRFGETERVFDFGDGYEPSQVYGAKWSVDLDAQFIITENLTVSLGANNLLDEYPDESIEDISYAGNLPYDGGVSPLGVNGRFVYMRATYNF